MIVELECEEKGDEWFLSVFCFITNWPCCQSTGHHHSGGLVSLCIHVPAVKCGTKGL